MLLPSFIGARPCFTTRNNNENNNTTGGFRAAIDETVEYDFAININIVVRDEIAADLLPLKKTCLRNARAIIGMVSIGTGNRINPRVWPAGFTAKEKQLVVSWKRRAITSTISYFASSINDFLSFEKQLNRGTRLAG